MYVCMYVCVILTGSRYTDTPDDDDGNDSGAQT